MFILTLFTSQFSHEMLFDKRCTILDDERIYNSNFD